MTVKFNLASVNSPKRSQLQAGTTFIYANSSSAQLYIVPTAVMTKITGVDNMDMMIGGQWSGSFEEAHMTSDVTVVDLTVTIAETQPVALLEPAKA